MDQIEKNQMQLNVFEAKAQFKATNVDDFQFSSPQIGKIKWIANNLKLPNNEK